MKTIQLTDEEIQALFNLMDAGVKYLGIASVKNAAYLLGKLEQAEEIKDVEDGPESNAD